MAPSACTNFKYVKPVSDVWSMGATVDADSIVHADHLRLQENGYLAKYKAFTLATKTSRTFVMNNRKTCSNDLYGRAYALRMTTLPTNLTQKGVLNWLSHWTNSRLPQA